MSPAWMTYEVRLTAVQEKDPGAQKRSAMRPVFRRELERRLVLLSWKDFDSEEYKKVKARPN